MARFNVLMMGSSVGSGLMTNMTNLSLALKRRGLNVVVISTREEQGVGLRAKLTDNGIRIYECECIDGGSPWDICRGAREIGMIVQSENIDIIHAQGIRHSVKAHFARRSLKRPVSIIQSLHTFHIGWGTWEQRAKWFLAVSPKIMNVCSDVVTPVSEVIGQRLVRAGLRSEKTMPIHNGIDLGEFDADVVRGGTGQAQSLGEAISGKPAIIYPAILVPRKGHRYLLEAAARVLPKYPDTRFIITGSGPSASELITLASDLNITENVIFTGRLGYDDLHWLISRATIGAFPSLAELLPMGILDMMAASLPVVATTVGGNAEMVADGKTGFLISPKDSRALSERILWLLGNPAQAREMGASGRKVAEDEFSIDVIARKTEEIYDLAKARSDGVDRSR